jgi:hypothetical protein
METGGAKRETGGAKRLKNLTGDRKNYENANSKAKGVCKQS